MGEIKRLDQAIGAIEQLAYPPNVGIYYTYIYNTYIFDGMPQPAHAPTIHIFYMKCHAVFV